MLFFGHAYAGQLSLGAQSSDPPRLDTWLYQERQDLTVHVEFGGKKRTVYLGTLEFYFNPYNPKDRVTVIKKIIPIIEPYITEQTGDKPDFNVEVINNYTRKAYQDALIKQYSDAKAIVYLRYSVVYDLRNEQEVASLVELWLSKRGGWVYEECKSPDKCELIRIEFVSESVKDKIDKNGELDNEDFILVGIQYSLNGYSQLLKFDQDELVSEEEKKKAAEREKKQ